MSKLSPFFSPLPSQTTDSSTTAEQTAQTRRYLEFACRQTIVSFCWYRPRADLNAIQRVTAIALCAV